MTVTVTQRLIRRKTKGPMKKPVGRVQKSLAKMAEAEGLSIKDFLNALTEEGISAPQLAKKLKCTHQAVSQICKQVGAEAYEVKHDLDVRAQEIGFTDLREYLITSYGKKSMREQAEQMQVSLSTLKRRRREILEQESAEGQRKRAGKTT